MEENIKNTFHLPIFYQETTQINDNIKNDLELLKTKDDGISWEVVSPDLTRNQDEKQGKGTTCKRAVSSFGIVALCGNNTL